jgi:predicted trehalose synthase
MADLTPETLREWAAAIQNDSVQPRLVVAEYVRLCASAWESQLADLRRTIKENVWVGKDFVGHIKDLERQVASLTARLEVVHAALALFEAAWDTGGHVEPDVFWRKMWPDIDRLIPEEHQSLTWAMKRIEDAALATEEGKHG